MLMVAPKFGTCAICSSKEVPVRLAIDEKENEVLVCAKCRSRLSRELNPSLEKVEPTKTRKRELPDLENFQPPPRVYSSSSQIDELVTKVSRNVQNLSDKVKKSVRDAQDKIKIPRKVKDKLKRKEEEEE